MRLRAEGYIRVQEDILAQTQTHTHAPTRPPPPILTTTRTHSAHNRVCVRGGSWLAGQVGGRLRSLCTCRPGCMLARRLGDWEGVYCVPAGLGACWLGHVARGGCVAPPPSSGSSSGGQSSRAGKAPPGPEGGGGQVRGSGKVLHMLVRVHCSKAHTIILGKWIEAKKIQYTRCSTCEYTTNERSRENGKKSVGTICNKSTQEKQWGY